MTSPPAAAEAPVVSIVIPLFRRKDPAVSEAGLELSNSASALAPVTIKSPPAVVMFALTSISPCALSRTVKGPPVEEIG